MDKPICYHAVCQYDVNACDKCEYDMDCYRHFLDYMMTGKESKKWNSEKH